MTNKVSNTKIDKVTLLLTKSYDEKEEKIKSNMVKALSNECEKHLTKEIMDFFKKYPNKVRTHGCVTFQHGNQSFYLRLDIPILEIDVIKFIVTSSSVIHTTLTNFAQDFLNIKLEKNIIRNQIKCTLNTLKTYNRIKANFPEAYDVLLYQVDKEPIPNLCDDIEELRAKLNKK